MNGNKGQPHTCRTKPVDRCVADGCSPPTNRPLTGMSLVWHGRAAELGRSHPLGPPKGTIEHSPESPCIPRAEGQNDLGRADLPAVLSEGCRLRPEQAREARMWLVRVVARRAVEIVKAQEQAE